MANNYICVRHETIKSAGACTRRAEHNFKKEAREKLDNVEHSKTKNNIHICFNGYDDKITAYKNFRIKAKAYKEAKGKKLRADAVPVIETVYTVSPDVIKTVEDERAFLRSVIKTHKELVGSCPFMLDLHLDETTIHAHCITIPYDKDLISYNQKINNKHAYSKIQDDFAKNCRTQKIEVIRGIDKALTGAKHEKPRQWNKERAEIEAEHQKKMNSLKKEHEKAISDYNEQAKKRFAETVKTIDQNEKQAELDYYNQKKKVFQAYKKMEDERLDKALEQAGLSKNYGIMENWKGRE